MKTCYVCHQTKPPSEFAKNRRNSDGLASQCKPCFQTYYAAWRTKNAERVRAAQREYCAVNAERQRQKTAAWYRANPDRAAAANRRWREANPDRAKRAGEKWRANNRDALLASKRQYQITNRDKIAARNKKWRQNNRGTVLADRALRKARKRQATPPWLTAEQRAEMREIYKESVRLSDETGIPHHVDHEIPLAGQNVCGLHVPWNLQILPAFLNLQKGNSI